MSQGMDGFFDELAGRAGDHVRDLVKQAYERGFREALTSSGQPAPDDGAVREAYERGVREGRASVDGVAPAPRASGAAVAWEDEASADVEDGPPEDDNEEAAPRPAAPLIRASATVDGLRRKIAQLFALERFDIEIVICRKGDRERRNLKGGTRLSRYLVGE